MGWLALFHFSHFWCEGSRKREKQPWRKVDLRGAQWVLSSSECESASAPSLCKSLSCWSWRLLHNDLGLFLQILTAQLTIMGASVCFPLHSLCHRFWPNILCPLLLVTFRDKLDSQLRFSTGSHSVSALFRGFCVAEQMRKNQLQHNVYYVTYTASISLAKSEPCMRLVFTCLTVRCEF